MSCPDLPLILSPLAEEDFSGILQYTLETWGEAQVFLYRAVLDKALLTIRQTPGVGHACQALSAQHRIFPAGRHIIVYRVTERSVLVSRILHERMDLSRHL